ncbi:hypothetical protein AAJP47_02380 [Psychrobacter sp. B38]|uniref:hypothetical protein n=1 Tax=Psychrobacter sp. B38 TaxID=3143538 RepID=UPI0032110F9E
MEAANIKKWVTLVGVAAALLVIPRRSSQKSDPRHPNKDPIGRDKDKDNKEESKISNAKGKN